VKTETIDGEDEAHLYFKSVAQEPAEPEEEQPAEEQAEDVQETSTN
jgi:hypothetical protein